MGLQQDRFLIVIKFVLLKKLTEFFLKSFLSVMLSLIRDVSRNVLNVGQTHGERSETFLPSKVRDLFKIILQPSGGFGLQSAKVIGRREFGWERYEEVKMILYSACFDENTIVFSRDSSQKFEETWADGIAEESLAVFGREDEMVIECGKCSGHDGSGLVIREVPTHLSELAMVANRGPRAKARG